jgi:ATP-dependent 26S proteasome regulatory subunit
MKHEFSGGQIKNIWLNAGRLAVKKAGERSGARIGMKELEEAVDIEVKGKGTFQITPTEGREKGYA